MYDQQASKPTFPLGSMTNLMSKLGDGVLLQVFTNMAVCYIVLNHYTMAKVALRHARLHGEKSSQIWYRLS